MSWVFPAYMSLVCLKGKGDQGVQNPGGQMDRPVSSQYLERLVGTFYTVTQVPSAKVTLFK